ncbi:uncharacterized protein [Antedon mediterranea]|uniref:uncharacterized protein n=1 Tax=Antedon mediterranea TaxID=105859 RepID=UPI003AF7E445
MDAVRTFNNELSGVYECKPPISRAKMTAVTKSAIKSIKMYKHVVQSVEKFIQKCRPEYKVPGLYVIDSIVRQSRHQFGAEKDVFAPRFAKNIFGTFQHLFKCPVDDKAKIVRVLNLWQKNGVFTAETVQPLLDMANPENVVEAPPEPVESVKAENTSSSAAAAPAAAESNPKLDDNAMGIVSQILQQAKQNEEQQNQLQHLQQLQQQLENHKKVMNKAKQVQTPGGLDPNMIAQIQQLAAQLNEVTSQVGAVVAKAPPEVEPKQPQVFNKSLLDDFDYEDDDKPSGMKHEAQQQQPPINQYSNFAMQNEMEMAPPLNNIPHPNLPHQPVPNPYNHHLMQQQEAFNREIQQQQQHQQPPEPSDMGMESEQSVEVGEVRSPRRRSHSRSRSRSPKRRRSRSRSRSRKRRRSRSRSRSRRSKRSRSRDRRERRREREKEKEIQREREKKGLPPIKKEYLSVCTRTVWLGHVPKNIPESEIRNLMEEHGVVNSIDMVPPRGCAYVVMAERKEAYKAIKRMEKVKLGGMTLKVAFAPGKGVKGKEYKENWVVEKGVTYIPWDRVRDGMDLDEIAEGAVLDHETIPPELKKDVPPPEIKPKIEEDTKMQTDSVPKLPSIPGLSVPGQPIPGLPTVASIPNLVASLPLAGVPAPVPPVGTTTASHPPPPHPPSVDQPPNFPPGGFHRLPNFNPRMPPPGFRFPAGFDISRPPPQLPMRALLPGNIPLPVGQAPPKPGMEPTSQGEPGKVLVIPGFQAMPPQHPAGMGQPQLMPHPGQPRIGFVPFRLPPRMAQPGGPVPEGIPTSLPSLLGHPPGQPNLPSQSVSRDKPSRFSDEPPKSLPSTTDANQVPKDGPFKIPLPPKNNALSMVAALNKMMDEDEEGEAKSKAQKESMDGKELHGARPLTAREVTGMAIRSQNPPSLLSQPMQQVPGVRFGLPGVRMLHPMIAVRGQPIFQRGMPAGGLPVRMSGMPVRLQGVPSTHASLHGIPPGVQIRGPVPLMLAPEIRPGLPNPEMMAGGIGDRSKMGDVDDRISDIDQREAEAQRLRHNRPDERWNSDGEGDNFGKITRGPPGQDKDWRGDRDWRGPQPEMRGPRSLLGPDMRGLGSPNMRRPGVPEMRGPGGPEMRGPGGPEIRSLVGPEMRNLGGMRGPGGAEMRGPGGPEMRGPGGPEMRGPGGPEMRGPGGPEMRGPGGSEMRGPGGPEMRGPREGGWPQRDEPRRPWPEREDRFGEDQRRDSDRRHDMERDWREQDWRDRSRGNRDKSRDDRDRGKDREDRERGKDRERERDRDREREKDRDRDRERDRDRYSRDRGRRGRSREEDRDRNKDRDRPRRSRWGPSEEESTISQSADHSKPEANKPKQNLGDVPESVGKIPSQAEAGIPEQERLKQPQSSDLSETDATLPSTKDATEPNLPSSATPVVEQSHSIPIQPAIPDKLIIEQKLPSQANVPISIQSQPEVMMEPSVPMDNEPGLPEQPKVVMQEPDLPVLNPNILENGNDAVENCEPPNAADALLPQDGAKMDNAGQPAVGEAPEGGSNESSNQPSQ